MNILPLAALSEQFDLKKRTKCVYEQTSKEVKAVAKKPIIVAINCPSLNVLRTRVVNAMHEFYIEKTQLHYNSLKFPYALKLMGFFLLLSHNIHSHTHTSIDCKLLKLSVHWLLHHIIISTFGLYTLSMHFDFTACNLKRCNVFLCGLVVGCVCVCVAKETLHIWELLLISKANEIKYPLCIVWAKRVKCMSATP